LSPGDGLSAVAVAVPVALVAGFTVVPVVVVAAIAAPVVTPARIPELTGAPVIVRERRGLGFGDGSRPQTSETETGAHDEGRCCDTGDVFLGARFSIHVTNDTKVAVDIVETIEAQVVNDTGTAAAAFSSTAATGSRIAPVRV
jgi:hypothetical protein